MILPSALERLVVGLARLPGVGEKTATRLAFFILREREEYAQTLAQALIEAHQRIHYCEICHNIAEEDVCAICRDTTRDPSVICVVEGIPDLIALDALGEFRGLYHVLHGVLAPLRGIGPDELKIASLEERLRGGKITEVIAATNVAVEGEATALYLKRLCQPFEVLVTRIASGIPMGGDLEYMDQVTLTRALAGRREF